MRHRGLAAPLATASFAVGLAAGFAAAGCSVASGGSPAVGATGPGGPAVSGSSTPGPLGTTPTAADCTTGQLKLTQLAGESGSGGTVVIAIQLQNTASTACSLDGYPSFSLTIHSASMATDLPAPVTLTHGGAAAIPFLAPPTKIAIGPGQTAGFLIAYANQPTGGAVGCDHASQLALRLSNSAMPTSGTVDVPLCTSTLAVSPFILAGQLSLS